MKYTIARVFVQRGFIFGDYGLYSKQVSDEKKAIFKKLIFFNHSNKYTDTFFIFFLDNIFAVSYQVCLKEKSEQLLVDRPLGDFFSRSSSPMDVGRPTVKDVPAVEGADKNAVGYYLRILTPEDLQSHKVFPRLGAPYTSPIQRHRGVFHGCNSLMSLPDLHGQVLVPS